MTTLLLTGACIADGAPLVDIAVRDEYIVAVGSTDRMPPGVADEVIDCAGRVVLPGLIESHLHLDKALLDGQRPNPTGTLAGAIAVTGELKASFTAEDVRRRAAAVLESAVANGTTVIRAHPDVDPIVGTLGVEVCLDLRETYRDLVDLQVVAFPQEGILSAPGTDELLVRALELGADVVGGCAYGEDDLDACHAHLDHVFALAAEYDLPVDIHADLADTTDDPRYALAEHIAQLTTKHSWQGRVTIGHLTSVASLAPQRRAEVFAELAAAGVSVVPLPATDVHLGGRGDDRDVRRGVAPVREMADAGVNVCYSSNNIRNGFTPYGNADLLEVGLFLAQVSHLSTPADLRGVLEMVTTNAATNLGLADHGIAAGCRADLVVLESTALADVLLDQPDRRYVVKNGRVVAETRRTTVLHRSA